jgi:hypothetical protein
MGFGDGDGIDDLGQPLTIGKLGYEKGGSRKKCFPGTALN